jgi:hypothetical protein
MTIGIAIPTYNGHLYHLKDLLYQISKSTILPSQVSISLSSYDGHIDFEDYGFEIILTQTGEPRNVSENLNISGSKLNTDIISFMGGDDLPHIKRNEYIIESFKKGAKAVVHNYIHAKKDVKEFVDDIGELELYIDYIDTCIPKFAYPVNSLVGEVCFANGPISLSREIFDKFKYGEGPEFAGKEDSIYNSNLINEGYKLSYIKNNLMLYIH